MHERNTKIIEAAFRMFARYGVKRTGMGDIAKEAGVARQTLYNAFSSKDEVLSATIDLFTERTLANIRAALTGQATLEDQLDLILDHLSVKPYDMLNATPNAQDIVEGFNNAGQVAIKSGDRQFRKLLSGVLSPYAAAIEASGYTVEQLADFVQVTASSSKQKARSRKHLLQLLRTLKLSVLVAADQVG
ncbi:MAG: TetR/AcrR family transcriptional regulator [Candidatus Phaeomarinobacter sp.]